MTTDTDDGSDLTSLGDEDERQSKEAAANDFKGLEYDSESSLTSDDEDASEISQSASQVKERVALSPPKLSPSRIGSSLTRPAPVVGLRTYGRGKGRFVRSFKQQTTTGTSLSPEHEHERSELSSTPSSGFSSPRKRRASHSAQKPLSSPSKRQRKRNGFLTGRVREPSRRPASSPRQLPNGHDSSPDSPSPILSTRRKSGGRQAAKNEEADLSISTSRQPRSLFPRRPESPKPRTSKPRKWSMESLEALVWVRVDRRNNVVNDDSSESFWWPAKKEPAKDRRKSPKVQLFFPPSGASTSLSIIVENPSSVNLVSYKDHSYTVNSFWSLPSSSASSRPSGFEELNSRWECACNEIAEEDLRLHDGFPTSLTALLSQPLTIDNNADDESASRVGSPERRDVPIVAMEDESWSPPPPDLSIAIPGELVLSTTRSKGFRGKFYPAKVIAYVPPSKPSMSPKYTVHFMDNLCEDVTRDMFYTYEQDEFGTCKLGQFTSPEPLDEKDVEDGPGKDSFVEATERIVFPDPPSLPAPPPAKFCELPMHDQVSYIIPVLTKVIESNYKPAEERVSAFLRGGRDRMIMSKEVSGKGLLTRSEFNELASLIRRWVLGLDMSRRDEVGASDAQQADARVFGEQALPFRSGVPDVAQETVHSPDDSIPKEITCQTLDKEPPPPSSLPPSSTMDESPSSSPSGAGGADLVTAVGKSTDDAKPNAGDHPTENGIQPITTEQPKLTTIRSFKDLVDHEKIHFCTEVLLKEAVIQLLLWRAGQRRSPELLSDTEESLLHESGSNLAEEFDIARTVRDLRLKKEKSLQAGSSSKQGITARGTRAPQRRV